MTASSEHRCSPASAFQVVGLLCCVGALTVRLFPRLADDLGADPGAAWLLFGFGLFLVATAALLAMKRAA
jgi:hypothetical protein